MPATAKANRAVVTGCAGFIGSHLTESLLEGGVSVVGIDCFNDNYGRVQKLANLRHAQEWDTFDFVPVDLALGDLEDLILGADCVYHLAAEPGVRSSWEARFERYVRNNVLASHHLLQALVASPGPRFVVASSSSVYGQAEVFPTPEDVICRPESPYGVTKLTVEQLLAGYRQSFGVPTVALRYFSVYGPRQRPDMAFHRFCRAALEGSTIHVFGDGFQTRDFTYVDDIVAATRAAGERPLTSEWIYNVGGGARTSVRETLEIISQLVGRSLEVVYEEVQVGDVRDTGADTTRAREELGFLPTVSVPDGLEAEFEWCKAFLERSTSSLT